MAASVSALNMSSRSLAHRSAISTPALASGIVRAPHRLQHRAAVRVQAREPNEPAGANSAASGDSSSEPTDFWEGEGWELFGKAASYLLPVLVVVAVGVGLFAAQTYNQDADVFLEVPKSPGDTAKLLTMN